MLKSITWPQVAAVALLLASTAGAYKYLGLSEATVLMVFTTVVAFLTGRGDQPKEDQ